VSRPTFDSVTFEIQASSFINGANFLFGIKLSLRLYSSILSVVSKVIRGAHKEESRHGIKSYA